MEKITDKIAALNNDAPFFSLEFFPPKTAMGFSNLQIRLERMSKALRPLFVNVTWGAGGSTAGKSLELAELCQKQLNLTTCLHLTCTNMRKSVLDDALEHAKRLGIRNVLALRGDPPRHDEYGDPNSVDAVGNESSVVKETDGLEDTQFVWAIDLVKYIRKKHGDWFCIGVAAYPDGHADESHPEHQDPLHDLPYLREKTKAGADFIMTQLFFDVEKYITFEKALRADPSGIFKDIPIIPGLMPIQSYQIFRRTTKLSHANVLSTQSARLEEVKGDDEEVKRVGNDMLCEMIEAIKTSKQSSQSQSSPKVKQGFHFFTLNLEKTVTHIIERTKLMPDLFVPSPPSSPAVEESETHLIPPSDVKSLERRRLSTANTNPKNRVVVENVSTAANSEYEALEKEAGVAVEEGSISRTNALKISKGEGPMGREATWDDFPNERWGDARSPAFGEVNGYGVSLHVSVPEAIKLWGFPVEAKDISSIFQRHVCGELKSMPWSEEDLSPETLTIKEQLYKINGRGWWTVASQPEVDGVRSSHEVFGWGPKNGFVFQKAFVEFFIPSSDWKNLREKLDKHPEVTYFAGNAANRFESSDDDAMNSVTWGIFSGKEIITPTIIEAVSFRAWLEEAFSIWREWQRVYHHSSPSAKLLRGIREDYWLVNIVHHDYRDQEALWNLLLDGQGSS